MKKLNIETKIDEFLWNSIQSSYSSRNYTASIIDAIFFLSNAIRERSGLESDGVALIGAAFGGKNPKLKVNKLQTESDWNIQKGIGQLLRGIYQGIRNPRSHEKYNDTQDDADSIIIFVNYLLKIICESKPPFTKQSFLNKIFDPYFPTDSRYSELLAKQIPSKNRLDILIDIFKDKSKGDVNKSKIFFKTLLGKLKPDETKQLAGVISEELEQISEESAIRDTIQILPATFWPKLDETVRIRTEHILAESIKSGQYDALNKRLKSGALGTWARSILEYFISRDSVIESLILKLDSNDILQQDYVFSFFFSRIFLFVNNEDWSHDYVISTVLDGLKNGDIRYYNAINISIMTSKDNSFKEKFQDAYDNFIEAKPSSDDDDIPF